jgi:hypothetical protein
MAGLIVLVRRYERALAVLLVLLPFNLWIFAWLYHLGVPSKVLRPLRYWPEVVLVALLVVAIRTARQSSRRLDTLDKICVGYLVLGALYLFVPGIFLRNSFGLHIRFYPRELGWRGDVLYIGLFVVGRHIRLASESAERMATRVLASGTAVSILGIWEFFSSSSFNRFAVKTVGVPQYQVHVLGALAQSTSLTDIRAYGTLGGHHIIRIGSVLDYQSLAFFCAVCLGIGAEMIARGRSRPWILVAVPIITIAMLATQTRSGIIAGVVAILVALRAQVGRSILRRIRLAFVVGLLGAASLPFLINGSLGHRLFGGDTSSNTSHTNSYHLGIHIMGLNPLGRGLATSAGAGQYGTAGDVSNVIGAGTNSGIVISEDQWLQIGTQLGYLGLALYASSCLLIIHKLRPRQPDSEADAGSVSVSGIRNSLIGILVGGTFLQPMTQSAVSWPLFLLAGIGVSLLDESSIGGAAGPDTLDGRPHYIGAHLPAHQSPAAL